MSKQLPTDDVKQEKWMSRDEREVFRTDNNLGPGDYNDHLDQVLESHDLCEQDMREQIGALKKAIAVAYQFCAVYGANTTLLAALSAVTNGKVAPHGEWPIDTGGWKWDECRHHTETSCAECARSLREQVVELQRDALESYLRRQWEWSRRTFGDGKRTRGIIQHITKELAEIEAKPEDLSEWIDVAILALDGFWRHGGKPEDVITVLQAKQENNFAREWPEPKSEDEAVEHIRDAAIKATAEAKEK